MTHSVYDKAFFDANETGSFRSACVVLGLAFPILKPASVLDVGCGVGTWLRAARDLGARELAGIDGPYIDTGRFHVEPAVFSAADLADPTSLAAAIRGRRFDLTMCLETAEHLSAGSAKTFVIALARTADVVLWSAAQPGQGGTHHVNERPITYWASLWHEVGFTPVDVLRPGLQSSGIDVWYAQNAILLVRSDRARSLGKAFAAFYEDRFGFVPPLAFLHPMAASRWLGRPQADVSRIIGGFAEAFFAPFLEATVWPGERLERVNIDQDGNLMWAAWTLAGDAANQPWLVLMSPDRVNLVVSLRYPSWCSGEGREAAAKARAQAAGLVWNDPTGPSIEGWVEVSDPKTRFRLTVSLADAEPDMASVLETAADAGRLWTAFFGEAAR